MALKWGICAAGKISNDFCSALKTLPKGEHEVGNDRKTNLVQ